VFTFRCRTCSEVHEGIPSFGWKHPLHFLEIPETERSRRCVLTSDTCVIDDEHFFVRGCLEIPVIGEAETLSWGVWASLSAKNFTHFQELYSEPRRAQHGPFFGWLNSHISLYPDTLNLKTMVHLRDDLTRPFVELEPTDHPLAVEQRAGITLDRVRVIYETMVHPPGHSA
jgi:hypothetical protein